MAPSVFSPLLLELPNSYRFAIPGINFGKVTDAVTDFYYFEVIREVLANTGYLSVCADFAEFPSTVPIVAYCATITIRFEIPAISFKYLSPPFWN